MCRPVASASEAVDNADRGTTDVLRFLHFVIHLHRSTAGIHVPQNCYRHTANGENKCETAIQTDSSQNSCCDDNADGDNNDNDGADAAGINMMLPL